MIRYVQKCEELIAFSCALGCHIFRCTCTLFVLSWHAVLWADVIYVAKVYYEQGWYTTGKLRTGVRAIWIACSVHPVSYLPGPQVRLTVTGCVLRGIIAFTSRLAAPTVFFPLKKWSRELYGIKYELWPASQKGTEGRMVDTIKNFLTQLRKGKVWSDPYLLYSPGCSTLHVAH